MSNQNTFVINLPSKYNEKIYNVDQNTINKYKKNNLIPKENLIWSVFNKKKTRIKEKQKITENSKANVLMEFLKYVFNPEDNIYKISDELVLDKKFPHLYFFPELNENSDKYDEKMYNSLRGIFKDIIYEKFKDENSGSRNGNEFKKRFNKYLNDLTTDSIKEAFKILLDPSVRIDKNLEKRFYNRAITYYEKIDTMWNNLENSKNFIINIKKSPYEILGVDQDATFEEIKIKYKQKLRIHKASALIVTNEEKKKFQEIKDAYEILKDPIQRYIYDNTSGDIENKLERVEKYNKDVEIVEKFKSSNMTNEAREIIKKKFICKIK